MKLIDKNLFINGTTPWPNQVFQKDFDAYFLLSYPPFQYEEAEVFIPFLFMNNIYEDILYVEALDNTSNFNYQIPRGEFNWKDLPKYYDAFHSSFPNEKYLLWQGITDSWAVVSDATNKVCVLACNWKDAQQVKMFFGNCLLSPKQFLQKINFEKQEEIFMKNYAPAKILIEGNTENPLWKKYYFQCHVNNENDKLFYWAQFEKLYHATAKLLHFCKGMDMYADQAFCRRYWMNKQWYSSGRNAPVGGFQKYNFKNCEKVATKFLSDNEHLKLAFEGKKTESDALYIASKKGLIAFYGFHIFGNLQKQKTKGGYADFHFNMCLHCHDNKDVKHNQNFEIFFREDFIASKELNNYLETLKTFCFVQKIHELCMPYTFAVYTSNMPIQIEGMYSFVPDEVKKSHPLYHSNT